VWSSQLFFQASSVLKCRQSCFWKDVLKTIKLQFSNSWNFIENDKFMNSFIINFTYELITAMTCQFSRKSQIHSNLCFTCRLTKLIWWTELSNNFTVISYKKRVRHELKLNAQASIESINFVPITNCLFMLFVINKSISHIVKTHIK
jgi:hypothetical protein